MTMDSEQLQHHHVTISKPATPTHPNTKSMDRNLSVPSVHPIKTDDCDNHDKNSQYKEILEQAMRLYENDKILSATRLLLRINNTSCFEPIHHRILNEGLLFQQLLDESNDHHHTDNTTICASSKDEWIKQGERHGRHNFCIYYKLSTSNHLTCRIETPIPSELLVPLLSVLNESELYQTWIPHYTVPKFEVVKSEKLRQIGRCGQIIIVETDVQWPLGRRQLLLRAVACDDIDIHSESIDDANNNEKLSGSSEHMRNGDRRGGGKILVRIQSLDDEIDKEELDGLKIPPTKNGYVRMEVQGGFVFEKCPADHLMRQSTSGDDNDQVLVTFSFAVDPKLRIPQSLINFFVRVAIGHLWGMFLRIAEDVKEGKRPAHSKAIATKREVLYDWVEERARVMLGR
ncbi:hypothetical protein ACHAW6_003881 [Cyclotella cf. meneghiniana]